MTQAKARKSRNQPSSCPQGWQPAGYTLEMRGIQAKLERAQESLEGLSSRIAFHCANEKVRLETATQQATDPDAGYEEPETIYEYSIAVGEIAYNLRSALDHLIWQLVSANGECPNHRHEFPIFFDATRYHKSVENRLRGLDDRQRGMIESFQPFQDNRSVGPHLWMLYWICNIDKHRHLNVVNTHSVIAAHLEGDVPPELEHLATTRGTALMDWLRGTVHEHLVKIDVVVDVCFRDAELKAASPGYDSVIETEGIVQRPPVVPALQSCLTAVVSVVEQLAGTAI